jgi:hypothetical protein
MNLVDCIRMNESSISYNNLNLDEQVKFIIDMVSIYGKSSNIFIKPTQPDQQQLKSKLNESSTSKKSLDLNIRDKN